MTIIPQLPYLLPLVIRCLELSERADEAAAGSRPPGRIGAAAGAGNGFAGEEGTVEEDKAAGV